MTDALNFVLLVLAVNLFLVPNLWAWHMLFPHRLRLTQQAADALPGRAFFIGLVNMVFLGGLTLALFALGESWNLLRLPALVFLAVWLGLATLGLAGVVGLLGARLRPEASPLSQLTWGTLTLSLGCALPLVGWFGLLPYALCLGVGAWLVSFFYRQPVLA